MKYLIPAVVTLLLSLASCEPDPPPFVGPEEAVGIEMISGQNQSGEVRSTLPEPLVVRVLSANATPVFQMPVKFRIVGGWGSLSDTLVYTDMSGKASVFWTMGDTVSSIAGQNVLASIDIPAGGINYVVFASSSYAFGVPGTMTDTRYNRIYATTQIGNQVWMAENLLFTGGSGNAYYNTNNPTDEFGFHYDWATAKIACPSGWHLPNNEEWNYMAKYLSGTFNGASGYASWPLIGQSIKSMSWWNTVPGTDDYNFNAMPAGYLIGGIMIGMYERAGFWSADEANSTEAYYHYLLGWSSSLERAGNAQKTDMYSCRCVRD